MRVAISRRNWAFDLPLSAERLGAAVAARVAAFWTSVSVAWKKSPGSTVAVAGLTQRWTGPVDWLREKPRKDWPDEEGIGLKEGD